MPSTHNGKENYCHCPHTSAVEDGQGHVIGKPAMVFSVQAASTAPAIQISKTSSNIPKTRFVSYWCLTPSQPVRLSKGDLDKNYISGSDDKYIITQKRSCSSKMHGSIHCTKQVVLTMLSLDNVKQEAQYMNNTDGQLSTN